MTIPLLFHLVIHAMPAYIVYLVRVAFIPFLLPILQLGSVALVLDFAPLECDVIQQLHIGVCWCKLVSIHDLPSVTSPR